VLSAHSISGGIYVCDVWRGFAKRGFGTKVGDAFDLENKNSFDVPDGC
jgi:hypothetical protein